MIDTKGLDESGKKKPLSRPDRRKKRISGKDRRSTKEFSLKG